MKIQKKFIAVFIAATLFANIVSENAEDPEQAVKERQMQGQAIEQNIFSPVVENKNNLDGDQPKIEALPKINNESREKQRAAVYELLFGTPDNKAIIRIIRTLKYMAAEDIKYFAVNEELCDALEYHHISQDKVCGEYGMIKNIDRCKSGDDEGCREFRSFIAETYNIRYDVGKNELDLMPFGYLLSAAYWERKTKESQVEEDRKKMSISSDFIRLALNKLSYEAQRCKSNENETSAPQDQNSDD